MVGVTGVGSLPGLDFGGALRATFDQLPELPYLPELPERGPWASMIGRTTAMLPGLSFGLAAGEWRLGDHPGLDQRRARATLRDDLDQLEETAADFTGTIKVALAGPWTMSASSFLPRGGRVLGDRAARRDLAASLAQGADDLRAEVARRLPAAAVLLQVDEPGLPAVLAGAVPTEGGYFRHRAVDLPEVAAALRPLAAGEALLHCCAPGVPIGPLTTSEGGGAALAGVSLDLDLVTDWDAIAELIEGGGRLLLGCLPTGTLPNGDQVARRVLAVLRPLGLDPRWLHRLVLTPTCGVADRSPAQVRAVFGALGAAARQVAEELSR